MVAAATEPGAVAVVARRLGSSTEPLVFGIDETVERRWGRKIAAKGRYRDPVRSTDDQVVMTPGLQWVSLTLLTRIGWAGRHWALPFLTALVVSARYDRRKGRRHQTVTDYAQQMLVCRRRWLPDRDLVVVADGGYAKREFRRHCQSMSKPIVVVTKLRKDASLYQPAPPRRPGQIGRPRVVGARLPSPTAVLDDPATQWIPYRATGSDGSTARVELASGVALWYHGGPPRLPIRWVVVRYLEERRGPYALLCTDTEAEPLRILQWYLLRWQVEVTPYQVRGRLFEELRAHLGMETQRQWSERAIARTTPALFGLFSVVTLAADILIEQRGGMAPRTAAWYDKTSPSFADAIVSPSCRPASISRKPGGAFQSAKVRTGILQPGSCIFPDDWLCEGVGPSPARRPETPAGNVGNLRRSEGLAHGSHYRLGFWPELSQGWPATPAGTDYAS